MPAYACVRSHPWACVTVVALVSCLKPGTLFAQRDSARYVGGTLNAPPNVVQYKCKSPTATLNLTSDSNLVFGADVKRPITVPYASMSFLKFGLETVDGAFCYPWDSYEQFTKKRHYLLTVLFQDSAGREQAVVFELEKATARATLAQLEARSGKTIEFTNAVACTQYKTADECGYGQPSELKGLTKVFIKTRASADRDRIAAEIAAARLGFTVLDDAQGAEIVLRYSGELVMETGSASAMMGGMPTDAGRGEVSIVKDGGSRVVVVFEDVKTSRLEKHPATNFARTFVDAVRAASAGTR